MTPKQIEVVYEHKVPVFAAALGSPPLWFRAYARGMKVIGLIGTVSQARKEAEGRSGFIVAQGHEGGGHTGHVGTFPLVRLVSEAVPPTPVRRRAGIVDGRGLVAHWPWAPPASGAAPLSSAPPRPASRKWPRSE